MPLSRPCSFYFLFTVNNSSITTIPINIVCVPNLYIYDLSNAGLPSGNTKLMVLEALGPMLSKSFIPIRDSYASRQYEELQVADTTCLRLKRYYCCINSFLPCITLLKHIYSLIEP